MNFWKTTPHPSFPHLKAKVMIFFILDIQNTRKITVCIGFRKKNYPHNENEASSPCVKLLQPVNKLINVHTCIDWSLQRYYLSNCEEKFWFNNSSSNCLEFSEYLGGCVVLPVGIVWGGWGGGTGLTVLLGARGQASGVVGPIWRIVRD